MRVSSGWLRDFVEIELPLGELVDALSMSGTKVEGVVRPDAEIDGVVVAEVLHITDHPNADNLILVEVGTGDGSTHEVVCGARNFGIGDRVPLARVGARLAGMAIEERKIRGKLSRGMLCSGFELGISKDHSGILVLPDEAELGADVVSTLGLDDVIIELEITPNRGDCMGVLGVAREIAAITGKDLKPVDASLDESGDVMSEVSVDIDDPGGCPRYVARYIEGVGVGQSPGWMQARLLTLGLRPISNIVDITNYVLLETGHPLHAFDAGKVRDHHIVVRRARPGEKLTTIDGQARELHADDLLIADPAGPLAIAGVMGGEGSEVSDETTELILESAMFDPASVSYTSRRHSLRTEASARFERGADVEMAPVAAARAAALMNRLAGGRVAAAMVDAYPVAYEPRRVTLRPERASAVLGFGIDTARQVEHLRALQLGPAVAGGVIEVATPSFRHDLRREEDLIEEVARLEGFDRLPSTLPAGGSGGPDPEVAAGRRIRRILAGFGLFEAWTSSFGSPEELDALALPADDGARRMIELANPTSTADPALRTTLLPGLLRSAARNRAQHAESVALFEIARVYEPTSEPLPDEPLMLGALLSGARGRRGWAGPRARWGFFSAKGVLEALFESLGIEAPGFSPITNQTFHPTRAASVTFQGEPLGVIGEAHPRVCERWEVDEGTALFTIALGPVVAALPGPVKVRELPRWPAVYLDLALVVDEDVGASRVADVVRAAGAPELASVTLFDIYRGEQVPEKKKSLAFALELRAADRTLTDEDADRIMSRIVTAVQERTGARVRS